MTQHYPVVVERENNGTFSAWVAGLAWCLCRGGHGGRGKACHPLRLGRASPGAQRPGARTHAAG